MRKYNTNVQQIIKYLPESESEKKKKYKNIIKKLQYVKVLEKTWVYYNYNVNSGNKETLNVFKFFILVKIQSFLDQVCSLGGFLSVILMGRIFTFIGRGLGKEFIFKD